MKIANYITIQPHEQQTMYLSELLTFNVHPSNLAETSSSMLGKELAEYHLSVVATTSFGRSLRSEKHLFLGPSVLDVIALLVREICSEAAVRYDGDLVCPVRCLFFDSEAKLQQFFASDPGHLAFADRAARLQHKGNQSAWLLLVDDA